MTYIATGRIFDDEVADRVAVHKKRRDARWHTIEEPLHLGPALSDLSSESVVLLDCATMWLTNHIMDNNDLNEEQDRLIAALAACTAKWIVVSNEVGHGIVPENKLARSFREVQGRLNIALAAEATLAVQIVAGLPIVLKGTLP